MLILSSDGYLSGLSKQADTAWLLVQKNQRAAQAGRDSVSTYCSHLHEAGLMLNSDLNLDKNQTWLSKVVAKGVLVLL